MNFSSFTLKALTAALILASTSGLALAKSYKGENYKGEAMPCPVPLTLKDGFYIGAQAGYDAYRVRESTGATVVGPAGTASLNGNPSVAATGWVGGLFLGYGQYLTDLFYLGGEIYGNYSGAEESHNNSVSVTPTAAVAGSAAVNTKIEARGSGGINLIPGIKLNDTSLGYVKLGWNWTSLKATQTLSGTVGGSDSQTHTSNGFGFGVGIETLVWDNWSVRTEYDHVYLNSFSTNYTSFDPSDNQFTVGILYHFA